MQNLWNLWPAKHSDSDDRKPSFDYSQVHKLKDGPPYDNIYVTSQGIQAIRAPSQKFNENGVQRDDSRVGNYYAREYSRETSLNENGEDINIEAEEFIREEREKLGFMKWKSTNSDKYY